MPPVSTTFPLPSWSLKWSQLQTDVAIWRVTCTLYWQVLWQNSTRISSAVPRDALHHGKRKFFTYPTYIWRLRWGDPIWVLPRFSAS